MAKKNQGKPRWQLLGTVLVLALFAGASAGVIAAVLTNQSLNNYLESLRDDSSLLTISEVKPRPLPGTYEEALARVREAGWESLAMVRAISVDSDAVGDWLSADNVAGYGGVITSDGWLVFHREAFVDFQAPAQEAEIWLAGERYDVEQYVADELSDFVMVKIEATNLSALAFGASEQMLGGDLIFSITGSSAMVVSSLVDADALRSEVLNPAEVFATDWILEDQLDVSTPLFNSAGEFVGLSVSENRAEPLHQGLSFINSALRSATAEHAALGAYVVDIDSTFNLDAELVGDIRAGALIATPSGQVAIVAEGPAAQADLSAGDIIIAVDDVLVAEETTLAELITKYRVGSQATLKIWRAGSTQEINVTFANFADLVY